MDQHPKAPRLLDQLRAEREAQIDRWKRRIKSVGGYGLLLGALFAVGFGAACGVTFAEYLLGWLFGLLQEVAHGW